jgi:hypothetical protein
MMSGLSAWDVYMVMQLDCIRSAVGSFVFIFFVGVIVSAFIGGHLYIDLGKGLKSFIPVSVLLLLFFGTLGAQAFIPSSKTAAAMCMLPQIANSKMITEDMPKELSEMYPLAKQALKDLVEKEGDE